MKSANYKATDYKLLSSLLACPSPCIQIFLLDDTEPANSVLLIPLIK